MKTPSFPIESTAFLYFPAGHSWAGKEPTSIWNIGILSTSRELSNCFKESYQLQIPSTLVCVPSLCSTLVQMAFPKDQILHALVHMAFSLARSSSVFCSAPYHMIENSIKTLFSFRTKKSECEPEVQASRIESKLFSKPISMARSTDWAAVKLTHWIWFNWLQWSRLRFPVTDASSAGYMYLPASASLEWFGLLWNLWTKLLRRQLK